MQGLVARGLTLEEIWKVKVNYVKVTAAKIKVKVTRSRYLPSQYIEKKHFARFDGCRPYLRRYRTSTQNVSKSLECKI